VPASGGRVLAQQQLLELQVGVPEDDVPPQGLDPVQELIEIVGIRSRISRVISRDVQGLGRSKKFGNVLPGVCTNPAAFHVSRVMRLSSIFESTSVSPSESFSIYQAGGSFFFARARPGKQSAERNRTPNHGNRQADGAGGRGIMDRQSPLRSLAGEIGSERRDVND